MAFHDPLWRGVAALVLAFLGVSIPRMAAKFLADRPGETFPAEQRAWKERFAAWTGFGLTVHGALVPAVAALALLALAVRSAPCDLRDFPGRDLLAALLLGARVAFLAFLGVAGLLVAPAQAALAVRYAVAAKRAAWGDERTRHYVVIHVVAVPVALLLEGLAYLIVRGPRCPYDPF